jgi:hypothetical protein
MNETVGLVVMGVAVLVIVWGVTQRLRKRPTEEPPLAGDQPSKLTTRTWVPQPKDGSTRSHPGGDHER